MATLNVTADGFEYKAASGSWPGTFVSESGNSSGTSNFTRELFVGNYGSPADSVLRDYRMVLEFGPVNVARGTSLSKFNLRLIPTRVFNRFNLSIKGYANSKVRMGTTTKPGDVLQTSFTKTAELSDYGGYTPDSEWVPSSGSIVIGAVGIAQEIVNADTWDSGDYITLIVDAVQTDTFGRLQVTSDENESVAGASVELETTAVTTGGTVINSVNSGNPISAGEQDILVSGSGFTGFQFLRIFKGSLSETCVVNSFSDTAIYFNFGGSLPTGTGYSLEITVDQETTVFTVDIDGQSAERPRFSETIPAQADGLEWKLETDAWPGTWAEMTGSSVPETSSFSTRIYVGEWGFPKKQAYGAFKIGPVNLDQGQDIVSFVLQGNVASAFRYTGQQIFAQADPASADIGPANLPSAAAVTTAQKNSFTEFYVNANENVGWVPGTNPKPIEVGPLAQEVVNNSNWSKGDSIWFIFKFLERSDDLGGVLGYWSVGGTANDGMVGKLTALKNPTIEVVSSDDNLTLSEQGVTIVGTSLAGASNLRIAKGLIDEFQTITSNTDTAIIFDLVDGDIVPDTGYTLSFEIGGVTFATSVSVTTGDGVFSAEADSINDGIELELLSSGSKSFINDATESPAASAFGRVMFTGDYGSPGYGHTIGIEIGPITAVRNQTFSKADLVLPVTADGVDLMTNTPTIVIRGVTNPNAPNFRDTNLPSDSGVTAASVSVNTSSWPNAASGSWDPGADQTVSIISIMNEILTSSNWASGKSVQLVITLSDPASGNLAFHGIDATPRAAYIDYTTAQANAISNVNGGSIIRHQDSNVTIFGNGLSGATSVSISDGLRDQTQGIKTKSATQVTFDFTRGRLKYGPAVLTLRIDGIDFPFNVELRPVIGRSYVEVTEVFSGDNSLQYQASVGVIAGDQIEFSSVSANGFDVEMSGRAVPSILGGEARDTFTVSSWRAGNGEWFDDQVIVFSDSAYFSRNQSETKYYNYETISQEDSAVVVTKIPDADLEKWKKSEPSDEIWTKKS